jgi:hypothetical protein
MKACCLILPIRFATLLTVSNVGPRLAERWLR